MNIKTGNYLSVPMNYEKQGLETFVLNSEKTKRKLKIRLDLFGVTLLEMITDSAVVNYV